MLLYKNVYEDVKSRAILRRAAEKYGVNYVSLLRYKRKRDTVNEGHYQVETFIMGYVAHNRLFNEGHSAISEVSDALSWYIIWSLHKIEEKFDL